MTSARDLCIEKAVEYLNDVEECDGLTDGHKLLIAEDLTDIVSDIALKSASQSTAKLLVGMLSI